MIVLLPPISFRRDAMPRVSVSFRRDAMLRVSVSFRRDAMLRVSVSRRALARKRREASRLYNGNNPLSFFTQKFLRAKTFA